MSEDLKSRNDLNIYKANKNTTGAAAQFKMGNKNDCMFLEVAPQCSSMDSDAPYDWTRKLIVKLGMSDLGKMLAYWSLLAPTEPLKLFHKNAKGSKTIELKYQEYKGFPSYYLTVSSKEGEAEASRISIPLAMDEVELLRIGFRLGVEIILSWK